MTTSTITFTMLREEAEALLGLIQAQFDAIGSDDPDYEHLLQVQAEVEEGLK